MANIQFIGYQIQTAATGNTARTKYPGFSDQEKDIEHRCKILMDAIEASKKTTNYNHLAQKIFVAPEFYFRGGSEGAYDITLIPKINEIMDSYIGKIEYKNWIFVLGTAIGAMPMESGTDSVEIQNIAIVRKGGVKVTQKFGVEKTMSLSTGEKNTLLVYKEYVSTVDYLGANYGDDNFHHNPAKAGRANLLGRELKLMATSGARPTGLVKGTGTPNIHGQNKTYTPSMKSGLKAHAKYRAKETDKHGRLKMTPQMLKRRTKSTNYTISEESSTGLGGGSIFKMNGHKFVLEICLDHVQERAKDANPANVDLHIVTSCGMQYDYSVAKNGGFFFLVDGMLDGFKDNITDGFKWEPIQLKKRVNATYNNINNFKTIDMTNSGKWRKHLGGGKNLFQMGKGKVYVFDTQVLA